MSDTNRSRNALQVMAGLIGLVKPLLGVMMLAIFMGCIGNLMASFITILGGIGIAAVLGYMPQAELGHIFGGIILFAVLRGILRYAEQAGNHYIAFKLLARIRHQVFASLRRLAPAKLDGREKGNLVSTITSDIELLEVFYAHTISPIAIAAITSVLMCLFISRFYWGLGILSGFFYTLTGIAIPVRNSKAGQRYGQKYRALYGKLNTAVLDNLYGLDEILQYQQQEKRLEKMEKYTKEMEEMNEILKKKEAFQKIMTDSVILTAGITMALIGTALSIGGKIEPAGVLVCTIAMMSSFGPTAALSALSNNLNQTLASGNRVLDLLEEEPVLEEVSNGTVVPEGDIFVNQASFAYKDGKESCNTYILNNFSAQFEKNRIYGISGKSGCGKSTLLKLLMRFYETDKGDICYGSQNVNEITTQELRSRISYVTQETFLFEDTIENNISLGREDVEREQVIAAAKKASIHEFISSLPNGYDTKLRELGESVSGGERQRIGIARAFLHPADILFLDEPTSNLDSLNEGIILESLYEQRNAKTMILISHRKSTMRIADKVIHMR